MGINTMDGFESALCKSQGRHLTFDQQVYQDITSCFISHKDNARDIHTSKVHDHILSRMKHGHMDRRPRLLYPQ